MARFPRHEQEIDYLRTYPDHFGLSERITLGAGVERVHPREAAWPDRTCGSSPRGGTYKRRRRRHEVSATGLRRYQPTDQRVPEPTDGAWRALLKPLCRRCDGRR